MKYFNESEFTDYEKMDPEFLYFLDNLRDKVGFALHINSSYRDPIHNRDVGGVDKSAHTEIPCKAADIKVESSKQRHAIVTTAMALGCTRIGIGETFVHLDFSNQKTKDVLWTYYK